MTVPPDPKPPWTPRQAMAFFASVIKCGESWTDECQRRYDEAMVELSRAALAPPEDTVMTCPGCPDGGKVVLMQQDKVCQWGGEVGNKTPFVCTVASEWWKCESCGEEWYTHDQSMRETRKVQKAIFADWQRLAALAPREPILRREVVEQPRKHEEPLRVGFDPVEREARYQALLSEHHRAHPDDSEAHTEEYSIEYREEQRGWARVRLVQEAYEAGQRRFYGPLQDALNAVASGVPAAPPSVSSLRETVEGLQRYEVDADGVVLSADDGELLQRADVLAALPAVEERPVGTSEIRPLQMCEVCGKEMAERSAEVRDGFYYEMEKDDSFTPSRLMKELLDLRALPAVSPEPSADLTALDHAIQYAETARDSDINTEFFEVMARDLTALRRALSGVASGVPAAPQTMEEQVRLGCEKCRYVYMGLAFGAPSRCPNDGKLLKHIPSGVLPAAPQGESDELTVLRAKLAEYEANEHAQTVKQEASIPSALTDNDFKFNPAAAQVLAKELLQGKAAGAAAAPSAPEPPLYAHVCQNGEECQACEESTPSPEPRT